MPAFNWDDLQVLLAIDRAGSLLAAARTLGLSHSTVARRLAAAEASLQATVFVRRGTKLVRSDTAEHVFAHAQRIEAEIAAFTRIAGGSDARLSGEVRLAAPMALLSDLLIDRLAAFRAAFPEIVLTLLADLSLDSMLNGDADIGLRISKPVADRLDIRRLSDCAFALYGSPAMAALARKAIEADATRDVPFAVLTDERPHLPESLWMRQLFAGAEPILRASTSLLLRAIAQSGLAVVALPAFLGDRSAGLERIATTPPGPCEQLYIVTNRGQRGVARVRAVVDFLVQSLAAERPRLSGTQPNE
jgi:DNA-binding transcriptional LysR family regulator